LLYLYEPVFTNSQTHAMSCRVQIHLRVSLPFTTTTTTTTTSTTTTTTTATTTTTTIPADFTELG